MNRLEIYKYPRTRHIQGSGIQRGDEDLESVALSTLAGRFLVIEEKMDGANSAISFSSEDQLLLQSRGHYLSGGERERQFHLFKTWAYRYTGELWEALTDRYIMYGEWLYAKHTVYYTALPHYFLEFDLLDKATGTFLSTERRKAFLKQLPFVYSVKVLYEGQINTMEVLQGLVGASYFVDTDQAALLRSVCAERRLKVEQALRETDLSGLMEGLYIKVEEEGMVKERYKYVRAGFLQTVFDSESHWLDRPIIPNSLKAGVGLF